MWSFFHVWCQNTFQKNPPNSKSPIREHVQISSSCHADAGQSGADFFLIPLSISTAWNGICNASNFFIEPINRGHQILTYICQRLSKSWNRHFYWQEFSMRKQAGKDHCLPCDHFLCFLLPFFFQSAVQNRGAYYTRVRIIHG